MLVVGYNGYKFYSVRIENNVTNSYEMIIKALFIIFLAVVTLIIINILTWLLTRYQKS